MQIIDIDVKYILFYGFKIFILMFDAVVKVCSLFKFNIKT